MSVIPFDRRCRHGRASAKVSEVAGLRAAKIVNLSAVRPTALAVSEARIVFHHSDGMLSRCHHLLTAEAPAPISDAMASRDGHNSMIARNEDGSLMPPFLRQIVLKSKPILSRDDAFDLGQNVRMGKDETRSEFTANFLGRTVAARKLKFEHQQEIAHELRMAQSSYSKYESRTPLPHYLMRRFCDLCGVRRDWLLTGEGPGPAWQPVLKENKAKRQTPKKVKAKLRKVS